MEHHAFSGLIDQFNDSNATARWFYLEFCHFILLLQKPIKPEIDEGEE